MVQVEVYSPFLPHDLLCRLIEIVDLEWIILPSELNWVNSVKYLKIIILEETGQVLPIGHFAGVMILLPPT